MKIITRLICKPIVWIGLFLFISPLGFSQELTERIVKIFKAKESTTLDITNKYGRVHLVNWKRDSVKIEIDMSIQSSSDSKVEKIRENIEFDFIGTEYYIIAKTIFGNRYNNVWSDLMTMFTTNNEVQINYTVYVPDYIYLKINNKYGDVYMDDFPGDLTVVMSHGDFKANSFEGKAYLNLSFANATINNITNGKITASYTELEVKNAESLHLESKSSKIRIDNVDYLKVNAKSDNYTINSMEKYHGESYFCETTINNLYEEINLKMKYGDLKAEKIYKSFSLINVNAVNADVDLFFEQGSTYDLDITHHYETRLKYPQDIADLNEKKIDEEEEQKLTYGKIGYGDSDAKVKINAPRVCSVNIFHR